MKTIEDLKKEGLKLNTIYLGHVLDVLKLIPDETVDCVITSPPYWRMRSYGEGTEVFWEKTNWYGQLGLEPTFDMYLEHLLEIFAEIKRVLKKTGSLWLNIGDCYGTNVNIIPYLKKEDKKRSSKYQKCLLMLPERLAIRMIDEQGWILRNKIKWAKQVLIYKDKKTMGNAMPQSMKDRFNETGEELYFFVKDRKNYYFNLDEVKIPVSEATLKKIQSNPCYLEELLKFNYRVRDAIKKAGQPGYRASEKEIEEYLKNKMKKYQGKFINVENPEIFGSPRARAIRIQSKKEKNPDIMQSIDTPEGYVKAIISSFVYGKNLPSIWLIPIKPHNFGKKYNLSVDHFSVFPEELCEIPIKASCPPNGIVLDPFMGSGTTAVVAKKLNRNFIGIEINPDYIKIAEKRLNEVFTNLSFDF